jgi:hypothetical protein
VGEEHGCGDPHGIGHWELLESGLSVLSSQCPNIPYDLSVDSAGDAVLELQVHLGDGVLGKDGGVGDITCPGCQFISS